MPLLLAGPLDGVEVRHPRRNVRRASVRRRIRRLEIMDCRLAVALLAWSETLRAYGVRAVDHYSAYRPGATVSSTGRESGHAAGLAIDVGSVHLDDGRTFIVDRDWTDKRRGAAPCDPREGEAEPQRVLRALACAAANNSDLFQIVLTPHHDEEHQNHVHLELRGGVTWSVLE